MTNKLEHYEGKKKKKIKMTYLVHKWNQTATSTGWWSNKHSVTSSSTTTKYIPRRHYFQENIQAEKKYVSICIYTYISVYVYIDYCCLLFFFLLVVVSFSVNPPEKKKVFHASFFLFLYFIFVRLSVCLFCFVFFFYSF